MCYKGPILTTIWKATKVARKKIDVRNMPYVDNFLLRSKSPFLLNIS